MIGFLSNLFTSIFGGIVANYLTGHQDKRKSGMTIVVITFLICSTVVVCTYMHYMNHIVGSTTTNVVNHYYTPLVTNHDTNEHGSMETSAGVGCPAESGTNPQGTRNCAASADQESRAAEGMPE